MSRDPYNERLKAWLDGELDAAQAAEIERHVAGCKECHSAAEDYRKISTCIRSLADSPVSPPATGAIRSRVARLEREKTRIIHALQRVAAAAALVFCITLCVAFWSSLYGGDQNPESFVLLERDNFIVIVLSDPAWEEEF